MLEKLQIIKLNEALVLFKMGTHITRHSVAKVMLGVFNIILVLTVIYALHDIEHSQTCEIWVLEQA